MTPQIQAPKDAPARAVEAELADGRKLVVREPTRHDVFAVMGGLAALAQLRSGKAVSPEAEQSAYLLVCRLSGIDLEREPDTEPDAVVFAEMDLIERISLLGVVFRLCEEQMAGIPLAPSPDSTPSETTSPATSGSSTATSSASATDSPSGPSRTASAKRSGKTTASPPTT